MRFAIGDDHEALAAAVERFFSSRCPPGVARAGLDSPAPARPPFWDDLAATGWLGLHLPERYGGSGYGLAELAVVLEGAGRAGSPGPVTPTCVASALIAAGGTAAAKERWLPGLASGRLVGAAAFDPATGLVLGGAAADVVVLGRGDGWYAVAAPPASARESLDPTRPVVAVDRDAVEPGEGDRLDLTTEEVQAVVGALVTAEAAGGAAWCVETAAGYAKVRVQFGRPIGQFQAVKHRCAGMLTGLELLRAAAWDAVAALGEARPDPPAVLAGTVAGAIAASEFPAVAKDCIQVLGGIGFTWEHDAHRYLRRAMSLAALLGGPGPWRRRAAGLALAGVRPRAGAAVPPGYEGVRAEARRLAEEVKARPREERRAALVEKGLLVPHWPPPWGRGAGAVEQLVIDEELARAGVRRPNLAVGAWAAPTIAAHGTPEQQERFVGPTLLGSIRWCQLFSEPGAGSDLAALTTRAEPVAGGWRLNGQKVWTSLAAEADYGICLARTDPTAPKHLGITYFVVDMKSPGIEVRPLRELTGMAMFNEVFLTDVFVPDADVIGDVNAGWALARTTLANERVAMGSGSSFGGGLEGVLSLAAGTDLGRAEADQMGSLVAESHCLAAMGRRAAARAVAGTRPGPEASVRKLLGAEHDQRTQEFGLLLLGPEAATVEGPAAQWTFGFLANRCLTIAGGTSEIQRNVIAERLLGLPRDPDVS